MKGRPPKPTEEHLAAKTFRKDRHAPTASKPLRKLPKPPAWLSKVAKAKWAEAGKQLVGAGILTRLDLDALVAYCEAWATWRKAQEAIEKDGLTFPGENGPRKHPAVAIAEASHKTMLALQERLGLTPYARQRLRLDLPTEEREEIEDFIDG